MKLPLCLVSQRFLYSRQHTLNRFEMGEGKKKSLSFVEWEKSTRKRISRRGEKNRAHRILRQVCFRKSPKRTLRIQNQFSHFNAQVSLCKVFIYSLGCAAPSLKIPGLHYINPRCNAIIFKREKWVCRHQEE